MVVRKEGLGMACRSIFEHDMLQTSTNYNSSRYIPRFLIPVLQIFLFRQVMVQVPGEAVAAAVAAAAERIQKIQEVQLEVFGHSWHPIFDGEKNLNQN